ncbi:MAG: hypothetical protein IPP71_05310 [Bacteroidetes bacterium]|nr:hypothetical protein [Bacteroidota bacterium]
MKKLGILLLGIFMISGVVSAQPFKVKSNVIGIGIGFGSSLGSFSKSSQTPGFSALYERGVWNVRKVDVISLGGYIGFKAFKDENNYSIYNYTQKWNYTIIGFRGAYHYNGFTNLPKLDIYGGAMVSYNILNYKYEDNNPNGNFSYNDNNSSGASATAFVGGRYFFNEGFGVYSELGYGVSFVTAGVCFKF